MTTYVYSRLAADLRNKVRFVEDRVTASEWSQLAQQLQRRAVDVHRKDLADLIYEPPPPKLAEH